MEKLTDDRYIGLALAMMSALAIGMSIFTGLRCSEMLTAARNEFCYNEKGSNLPTRFEITMHSIRFDHDRNEADCTDRA